MKSSKRSRATRDGETDEKSGLDDDNNHQPAAIEILASQPPALSASESSSEESGDSPAILNDFVSQCFHQKVSGDPRSYYLLCAQLSASIAQKDGEACCRWFDALISQASLISSDHTPALFELLFSFDVSSFPSFVFSHFSPFLLAHFTGLNRPAPILKIIVKQFTLEFEQFASHHQIAHGVLSRLVSIAPQCVSELAQLLMENFPHRRVPASSLTAFCRNFLAVLKYAPALKDRLLSFLFEQILSIDVEISVSARGRGASASLGPTGEPPPVELRGEMAEKLDDILVLVFEYLSSDQSASDSLNPQALLRSLEFSSSDTFGILLRVFERSILRTHQSRFTQFLIFFYCSFKHVYAEAFLRWLLEKAFDRESSQLDRQNAALYIASFTGRAAFLRHASTIVAFEMLLQWCVQYLTFHESLGDFAAVGPLEAPRHAHFYRCFQACVYLLLFRQHAFQAMIEADEDLIEQFHFSALVHSRLNPLRFCQPQLVIEFDRVARALKIVDCREILEKNKKFHENGQTKKNQQGKNGESAAFDPNDSFFPFDPYFLPESQKFLEPLFAFYEPVKAQKNSLGRSGDSSEDLKRLSSELSDIAVSPQTEQNRSAAQKRALECPPLFPLPPAQRRTEKIRKAKGTKIFSSSRDSEDPPERENPIEDDEQPTEEDSSDSESSQSSVSPDGALSAFAPTFSPTFSPSLPPLNPMAGLNFNSTEFQALFNE